MYCHTCLKCGNHWDSISKNLECSQCGATGDTNIGFQWVDVEVIEKEVKDNIGFSADIKVKDETESDN